MAKSTSAPTCGCPVAAFQKMISGKYKLRIVWDLQNGPLRYGEIRTGLLRGADGSAEIAPRVADFIATFGASAVNGSAVKVRKGNGERGKH